jgi:hypothetical protein
MKGGGGGSPGGYLLWENCCHRRKCARAPHPSHRPGEIINPLHSFITDLSLNLFFLLRKIDIR